MNMAESACLRRSFSHPSSSSSSTAFPEFNEGGDPIRALTESVSFGRFVSDSLHWEKWSSFSSNRYLEEAERFSRPGSVAQMRAFFEAHYRKRAARHALVAVGDSTAEGQNDCEKQEEESMQSDEIVEADNCSSVENHGMNVSSIKMDCLVDVRDAIETGTTDESKSVKDDHDLNKSADSRSEILPDNQGTINPHSSDSHEVKELKSSTTASTLDQTLNPRLMKAAAVTSEPKIVDNVAGNARKSSRKRTEEKAIGPRLLHMSNNLASSGSLSQAWKTRCSKFPPTSKGIPGSTFIGNKPKAPVCAAPKHFFGDPSLDVKRASSILSKSTTALMRTKLDKKPNPLHTSYSRGLTIAETRARPATVCAAFGLRSAERAEKRKEFFLKQQERVTAKEAERGRSKQSHQPSVAKPQPRSPKSRNNLSSNGGPDARPRPPRHDSTNPSTSKFSRRTTTYSSSSSSSSHPRKNVQENASPNIPV